VTTKPQIRAIRLTHGKWALVDKVEYDWLIGFQWRAVRIRNTWYAHAYLLGGKGEFMHRMITGVGPDEQVDHRDGDGLNNRRANLRPTTRAMNQANRRKVWSRTGYKGVRFDGERERPWRAYITVKGKQTTLGQYETAEEAARAYDRAAREQFGEFAKTNEDLRLLDT
jgi:hypothetical protein